MKRIGLLIMLSLLIGSAMPLDGQAKSTSKKETICIDPGHQKKQNLEKEPVAPRSKVMKVKVSAGTSGVKTKIPEYKLNLQVGLKLKAALVKKGYRVHMTRTTHDVNISNAERAKYCNAKKAALTVRIHADGSTDRKVEGISVLYPDDQVTKAINKTSKKQATIMLKHLIESTKAKKSYGTGLVPRKDLTGFNWSKTPVVLIEMGFMSNPTEDQKLASDSYQKKLVNGMVKGIDASLK